jgi:hypothetical protein
MQIKKIRSLIIEEDIQGYLQENMSLINTAQNRYTLIDHLLISSVFCPELVVIEDAVFVAEFFGNTNYSTLYSDCNGDITIMEKMINTKLLTDFFLLEGYFDEIANENENLLLRFGLVVKYFWQKWFSEKLPDRIFTIEVGRNLFPESDLAITVFQEKDFSTLQLRMPNE